MFVGEPGLFAYVNVARWMRIGFDGGYRFVAREAWSPGNDFRLAGPYFGINFEFGWFDKKLDR
jgi:hypothetical protein